jgi:SNF2 family DNA or RNA helicase
LSTLPFSKTPDGYTAYKQSPKLQAAVGKLKDLLNQDKRKKAVVFSNFITAGLHPYAAALEHEKIPFGYYYGGISPKVRQANLDAYNRGQLKVLLLGPAGSEGISTKGTSLLQLLDPHWNEARSSQAKGRGLRFDSHEGLPDELKNVQVQKFLSISEEPSAVSKLLGRSREKTGDEIISNLAKQKQELSDKFLEVLRREGQSNRT